MQNFGEAVVRKLSKPAFVRFHSVMIIGLALGAFYLHVPGHWIAVLVVVLVATRPSIYPMQTFTFSAKRVEV